ncbi:MAG: HDOD domain-containing protein [Deltaproteobacteria bacterium]|nr:HDOD domain-containing protein [Deltaproteobacteria bacterium]
MVAPSPARTPAQDLPQQLIQQIRSAELRIPPYPAVASSLERLGQDGSTLPEVAAIVATDAALAANVLRHAASAVARTTGPITLEAAIWKLGFEELVRLVFALSLGAGAGAPGPLAPLRRDQWRRSLLSAMFCKELAPRRGLQADQAFLAGLLHDFGGVAVLACIESSAIEPRPTLPEATWRELVEMLHVEFGMIIATRWKLPEAITEVIAHHHAPQGCARVYRPLVQLVAAVDQIIAILDRGSTGGIAALTEVPGLEHDERFRIGALMPKVGEQMAAFEAPISRESAPSAIERTQAPDEGWPVDFPVEGRRQAAYRAVALAPNAFKFRSATAMQPGWLHDVTLHCPPESIAMMVNVTACDPTREGDFLIAAQPFGLSGDVKAAWLRLVGRTRRT